MKITDLTITLFKWEDIPAGLANGSGNGAFEIEILGDRFPARIQAEPLFDP